MYESIFDKTNENPRKPEEEFQKINKFLQEPFYNKKTLYSVLSENFSESKFFRRDYRNLSECIEKNTQKISAWIKGDYIFASTYEDRLNEFLNYCEIVRTMSHIFFTKGFEKKGYLAKNLKAVVLRQFIELVDASLKSFGYKTINSVVSVTTLDTTIEEEVVKVIKINPKAEYLAIAVKKTNPKIEDAIFSYLRIRDDDVEKKREQLSMLIDVLRPTIIDYNNQENIARQKINEKTKLKKPLTNAELKFSKTFFNDVSEYTNVIRHWTEKKENRFGKEKQYKWCFEDENKFMDDVFLLCLYVVSYIVYEDHCAMASDIVTKFEELKNKSENE